MILFLDAGVLGGLINPTPKSATVQAMQSWATQMQAAGHPLIVPAIADYEQRREHERRGAVATISALDTFTQSVPGRYLALTDSALKRAALLWADVRQRGLPTADAKALDCDIILAAQILDLNLPDGAYVVATDNVSHLSRVIASQFWQHIHP